MATKVTRDHHLLTRNLKLNGNYISNDGGDEGISIDNDGIVTASSQIDVGNVSLTTSELDVSSGDFTLDVAGSIHIDAAGGNIFLKDGGTTFGILSTDGSYSSLHLYEDGGASSDDYFDIRTGANGETYLRTLDAAAAAAHLHLIADGNIALHPANGGKVHLINTPFDTTDATNTLVHIDLDSNGHMADGETLNNIGLDLDVTRATTSSHSGSTISNIGIDLDVTSGDTDGTSSCLGVDIVTSGADNNYGMNITVPDETGDHHIKLIAADNTDDYCKILTAENGATTITTIDDDTAAAHLTLDVDGDITLDAYGKQIYLAYNGINLVDFDLNTCVHKFRHATNTDDLFSITVAANGVTTLATVDDDTAVGHLTLDADGHVEFRGCAAGFRKKVTDFSDNTVVGGSGDTTDIDFRNGNKHQLTLTDVLAGGGENLNMIFPATSGNFILVICQDGTGDRTIATDAWRAYQVDGSTEGINTLSTNLTDGDVRWAGGSAPTLSTAENAVDVISIYWDADHETALAVASLDFATPA